MTFTSQIRIALDAVNALTPEQADRCYAFATALFGEGEPTVQMFGPPVDGAVWARRDCDGYSLEAAAVVAGCRILTLATPADALAWGCPAELSAHPVVDAPPVDADGVRS